MNDTHGDTQADAAILARALEVLNASSSASPRRCGCAWRACWRAATCLIEDVPGVGKTTLAHALAHVLGLAWQRVQFTSDLLPADIIGVSVFDRATPAFEFRAGPDLHAAAAGR